MSKKWYVLHTYSGYENKVKTNLEIRVETMGLENNVFAIEIPTEMVTEIKEGGRRVESEKKVFPGYVLVRMELDDRSWAAVRNTPGVTGFVGSDGKPAPLTRDEYNKIMKRTSHEAPKKTSTTLEVGQTVKVVSGPLAEFDGVVSEVAPECRQGEGHGIHLRSRNAGRAFLRSGRSHLKLSALAYASVPAWTGASHRVYALR